MAPTTPRHDDAVPVLRMVLVVAAVVAFVILIFFGVGYGLGRAFV